MNVDASASGAAVSGLTRSDPHAPGIVRQQGAEGFRYRDASGVEITDSATRERIGALSVPPAWKEVWISPDPLGHIQATGVDSRGRTQYRYHQLWREQREVQKFSHMVGFARALPDLRTAAARDLRRPHLDRDRVAAAAVRLIDLGLFRIGGERYAELDHHYGAITLRKSDVTLMRDSVTFDYVAKEGKRRTISINDHAVVLVVGDLMHSNTTFETLFCHESDGAWRPLHSHEVSTYIAVSAGGHFTAKEFRTWNATVLMALFLANSGPAPTARSRKAAIVNGVREVAESLGDTPTVARNSYIDPRVISRYEADGQLPTIPRSAVALPAAAEAEVAVAALLT
jgi:DNA topoisomerase-1